MNTTYNPLHYDIWVTPTFVKDGQFYQFEGLDDDENGACRGVNFEFRFIVNTLRHYFGDNLDFDENENQIKIDMLSNEQMKTLRVINEDTCEFPVKYGRSYLKFEINGFKYIEPPCDNTMQCYCRDCYLSRN